VKVTVWSEPRVTVIGRPQFTEPDHLQVEWLGEPATDGERLIEYAGRICYMSQHNPAHRSTEEYITNILSQRHGSVLEHATYSVLLEGVSRSLTHELIRHRVGVAISQLSQRFVLGELGMVVPPAVIELGTEFVGRWQYRAQIVADVYANQLADLKEGGLTGKKLKEAARCHLPNEAETKLVFTANIRAWRHMIEARCAEGADAEIRRLFTKVLQVLRTEAPACFSDFTPEGSPTWSKV
jgi:thymidylate synthase (FAD)